MAFTISAAVALLAAIAQATRSPAQVEARQSSTEIDFEGEGADGASYVLDVPTDGSVIIIGMSIPIDAIFFQSSGPVKSGGITTRAGFSLSHALRAVSIMRKEEKEGTRVGG